MIFQILNLTLKQNHHRQHQKWRRQDKPPIRFRIMNPRLSNHFSISFTALMPWWNASSKMEIPDKSECAKKIFPSIFCFAKALSAPKIKFGTGEIIPWPNLWNWISIMKSSIAGCATFKSARTSFFKSSSLPLRFSSNQQGNHRKNAYTKQKIYSSNAHVFF